MAKITSAISFMWASTAASIPSGWSRTTDLDGYFVRLMNTGDTVGGTGGNSTHTHTSASHSHLISAHTHTFTLPAGSGGSNQCGGGSQPGVARNHTHGTTTSGAANGETNETKAPNYSEVSNNPPYIDVIFIHPNSDVMGIPVDVISLMRSSSLGNLTLADGNNSTVNCINKYPRGAAAAGNGGGTGGSTTNTHALEAHAHTNTHGHAAATTAAANAQVGSNTGGSQARNGHTHSVSLDTCSTLTSDNNSTDIGSQSETVEPAYVGYLVGQNKTAGLLMQVDMVGFYLGTDGNIPTDWASCGVKGKIIKCVNSANAGTEGGSDTHTHAAQGHTHTISGTHTHNVPAQGHVADIRDSSGSTNVTDVPATTHAASTSSTASVSLQSANTSADSANNVPPYKNVKLIYLTKVSTDWTKEVTDTATATSTLSKGPGKTLLSAVTITESMMRAIGKLLTNTVTATSSIEFLKGLGKTFSEVVTITDNLSKRAGKTFSSAVSTTEYFLKDAGKTLVNSITATEIFSKVHGMYKTLTDAVTSTSSLVKAVEKQVSEVISATENLARGITRAYTEIVNNVDLTLKSTGKTLSEAVSHTESFFKGIGRTLTSSVTISEVFEKTRMFWRTLVDSVLVSDIISRILDKFPGIFSWGKVQSEETKIASLQSNDTPQPNIEGDTASMSSSEDKPISNILEGERPSL